MAAAMPVRNRSVQGILLLVLATIVFAIQDAITKQLTESVPVSQLVFIRFSAFALFAILYAAARGGLRRAVHSATPVMQLVRCVLMCSEIALFAYALRTLGLAEIHAIFACFPLLVTALSVPLLGEAVGWRRWVAVCIGFLGTLIILQPGSNVFDPAALMPLVCALIYAVYNLLTRRVSRVDSFETSLLYFGVIGMLASAGVAWFNWQPVAPEDISLLVGICLTSVSAHLMLIKSLELTTAVVLQPFNYFILVWAILIGYVVFGEVLSAHEWLGAAIVVSSALYIGYREYRLAQQGTDLEAHSSARTASRPRP